MAAYLDRQSPRLLQKSRALAFSEGWVMQMILAKSQARCDPSGMEIFWLCVVSTDGWTLNAQVVASKAACERGQDGPT